MANDVEDITIETSTDTIEQVQEALGASVEIEESPTEETETEKKPAAKPSKQAEAEAEPEEESATETEEEPEETEEPTEEKAETATEKPKKAVPATVPRSRLNQEIEKRKAAERRLAALDATPTKKEPEATEPEARPETFSGKPEPKIEDFLNNEKYPDPYAALNKATAAWVREETRAEIAFDQQREKAEAARQELIGPFLEREEKTLERRPDYNTVVKRSQLQITGQMEMFVYDSEVGPDMLLYFVENPKEAKRIGNLRSVGQAEALIELQTKLKAEIEGDTEEGETEEPPAKKTLPPKKTVSKAPLPPSRLKATGPGPKSERELAGPEDRTGVDIEFNPELERLERAKRQTR